MDQGAIDLGNLKLNMPLALSLWKATIPGQWKTLDDMILMAMSCMNADHFKFHGFSNLPLPKCNFGERANRFEVKSKTKA